MCGLRRKLRTSKCVPFHPINPPAFLFSCSIRRPRLPLLVSQEPFPSKGRNTTFSPMSLRRLRVPQWLAQSGMIEIFSCLWCLWPPDAGPKRWSMPSRFIFCCPQMTSIYMPIIHSRTSLLPLSAIWQAKVRSHLCPWQILNLIDPSLQITKKRQERCSRSLGVGPPKLAGNAQEGMDSLPISPTPLKMSLRNGVTSLPLVCLKLISLNSSNKSTDGRATHPSSTQEAIQQVREKIPGISDSTDILVSACRKL